MLKIQEIKDLMRTFDKSGLSKLKLVEKDQEIVMEKGGQTQYVSAPAMPTIQAQAPQSAPATQVEVSSAAPSVSAPAGDTINSPMVGTFYEASSPDSPAFVKEGDRVKAGQTLCILEAMKIMNEIEAEFDCKIVKVLVNNGDPVEYDMPIFAVEKL